MRRSRLTKNLEKKTKRSLLISVTGILILAFIVLKFGIPLLINFTTFLSSFGSSKQQVVTTNTSSSFVAAPSLNPILVATNSADIIITGTSLANQSITLYDNGIIIDKEPTQNDGTFSFKETLNLGENDIKAKATANNMDSDFSPVSTITYKTSSPNLTVSSPSNGQSFSKDQNSVDVTGSTDAQVRVTVNGFWAIIDQNNNYSYILPLNNGNNSIKVIATDEAGNTTEKDISVTYSP